uniref:BTB domain-containing protein n=1 Tax=Panagrolaimus sp. ES5 TaxID=591445 RepID=A0AC34G2G1_9BILA
MMATDYEVHFVWSIKKEIFLNEEHIESQIFETTLPNVKYSVNLWINENRDGIIAIGFCEPKNTSVKEMKLFIPSANFQADFSVDELFSDLFLTLIKHEDILNPEKKFFVNDILKMEFRGILCYKTPKLGFLELMWEKDDKDFTLIVGKENKQIKGHKFILRQFSSVFAAAIDSKLNEIKIENFNKYVVKAAVKLCYEIDIDLNTKNHLNLIKFTNIYDMPIIKEQAEYKFQNFISEANICEIANKSIEYHAENLRGLCVNFLSNCIKNGKPFDEMFEELNPEIIALVFKNSFCHIQKA